MNYLIHGELQIFCTHGGLSPDLYTLDQVKNIRRPTDVPDEGLLCDLLWSDPDPDSQGWTESDRGVSYIFGTDVVDQFLKTHDLDLVCRAHPAEIHAHCEGDWRPQLPRQLPCASENGREWMRMNSIL
ncbi:hypothetical protein BBJ28_00018730 [Nothophytophthora sp. Chile5]|nr:hypothetical protein BBJ28_00018730 [Nothophytophthora sp. Chile5]